MASILNLKLRGKMKIISLALLKFSTEKFSTVFLATHHCGNLRTFSPLRFYVKSNLAILKKHKITKI